MARYLGPRCKLSRSVGSDLGLIGIRDGATKCKAARPGQHGQKQRRRTEYGVQLCEKQRIRYYYGVLERQFKRYYAMADRQKGSTGDNLLRLLESRLDNLVYRMGFAITRAEARQLVSHGSIKVNGKKVNIPSYLVSLNDVIEISDKSKKQLRIALAMEMAKQKIQAHWLDVDAENFRGVFKVYPENADFPAELEPNRVIELFSK